MYIMPVNEAKISQTLSPLETLHPAFQTPSIGFEEGPANYFCEGLIVNILSFASPIVSITIHNCHHMAESTIDNKETDHCGFEPTRLYIWTLQLEDHIVIMTRNSPLWPLSAAGSYKNRRQVLCD